MPKITCDKPHILHMRLTDEEKSKLNQAQSFTKELSPLGQQRSATSIVSQGIDLVHGVLKREVRLKKTGENK